MKNRAIILKSNVKFWLCLSFTMFRLGAFIEYRPPYAGGDRPILEIRLAVVFIDFVITIYEKE